MSTWATIPALLALLLVLAEYGGRLSSRTPRTPKLPVWIWIAGLIATYGLQLVVICYAATHEYPTAPWRLTMMPFPVVDMPGTALLHANIICLIMLGTAALQSYALLALYRLTPSRTAVAVGCGVLLLASVTAPSLISADLYGYVHDSMLGIATYDPPMTPFAGEYHVFDLLYGVGDTTLYGPLWLALIPFVTFAAPTLSAKIIALRTFSLALFLALLVALRALGLPARIRNVTALNPALMLQFISNGHNDLIPLDFILWGAVWIRTQPALSFCLLAAAGLAKLPYAVLGLPIVAGLRSRCARVTGSIIMLIVVAAVSWFVGRTGYAGSLATHVSKLPATPAHELAALAGALLMVVAALSRRRLRAAVWTAPMISAAIYSWYFIWALPYALTRRRVLGYLLICFPFVSLLAGLSLFMRAWQLTVVLPLVVIASINVAGKRRQPLRKAQAKVSEAADKRSA